VIVLTNGTVHLPLDNSREVSANIEVESQWESATNLKKCHSFCSEVLSLLCLFLDLGNSVIIEKGRSEREGRRGIDVGEKRLTIGTLL